jgi:cbb3-type cytochrome c oxidase subunit III
VLAGLAIPGLASDSPLDRHNEIMSNERLRQQAYNAGEERVLFCGYCHGADGNSKRDYIPNLAGQNPVYLFNAFRKFGSGERPNYVMSELAKTLSEEEQVNIAIYYSRQEVTSEPPDSPALYSRGETVFSNACSQCHGREGKGHAEMPRLAGQPAEYIRNTLRLFRNKDPGRKSDTMRAVAANLSDHEIQAVAEYVQSMGGRHRASGSDDL